MSKKTQNTGNESEKNPLVDIHKDESAGASIISHLELARLWDIVIRAHYLAYELNDPCARSGLEAARMALALSEVLSNWAGMFGEELEVLEKRVEKRAKEE